MALLAEQLSEAEEMDLWQQLRRQAKSGQHQLTEATARRILELGPADPFAEQFLAAALLKQGKTDEARAVLLQSAANNPENGQASHMLSTMHFIAGEYDTAILHAIDAVGREPVNFAFMLFLGKLLFCAKRFEESAVACERAAQLEPESIAALSGLARTLAKLKMDDAARQAVAQMMEHHPDDAVAQCEAGWTYLDLGLFDIAERHLQTARLINPDLGSIYAGLAMIEYKRKDPAEAARYAKEAVCTDPGLLGVVSPFLTLKKPADAVDAEPVPTTTSD